MKFILFNWEVVIIFGMCQSSSKVQMGIGSSCMLFFSFVPFYSRGLGTIISIWLNCMHSNFAYLFENHHQHLSHIPSIRGWLNEFLLLEINKLQSYLLNMFVYFQMKIYLKHDKRVAHEILPCCWVIVPVLTCPICQNFITCRFLFLSVFSPFVASHTW